MDCFICRGSMSPFFSKDFEGRCDLYRVDYWKCGTCGMVISKTHFDMSIEEWGNLNRQYHSSYQGTNENEDDPRWLERLTLQTGIISELSDSGILPKYSDDLPWVDYACGDGKLADMLGDKGFPTFKYDRYMVSQTGKYLDATRLKEKKYSLVINTSVFEHVREIDPLDEIVNLVSKSGVLALHTMVCKSVPKDPSWFYLLPVHCAFYTNRSMQILFDRWGFKASIYHVESRMWFWFRNNGDLICELLEREKDNMMGEYYFKQDFMDYYKE